VTFLLTYLTVIDKHCTINTGKVPFVVSMVFYQGFVREQDTEKYRNPVLRSICLSYRSKKIASVEGMHNMELNSDASTKCNFLCSTLPNMRKE